MKQRGQCQELGPTVQPEGTQSTWPTSPPAPTASSEILRFNSSVEGVTESCCPHCYDLLQGKIQTKSAKGRDTWGRVREIPTAFHSWHWRVTIYTEHCQPGKATQALAFRVFTGAHYGGMIDCCETIKIYIGFCHQFLISGLWPWFLTQSSS